MIFIINMDYINRFDRALTMLEKLYPPGHIFIG